MNIEETKKIIQNKIQADEAAREVRSQIKTYIHEKQNAREGFTETFKPLIETSEKVKESIDTQQNKLIEQLQKHQLALTAGFEGNRKAITSGFDKMDEVKRWDIEQLPGYEAIEEPEIEDEKPKIGRIRGINEVIKEIKDEIDILNKSAQKAEEEENLILKDYYLEKIARLEKKYQKLIKEREIFLKKIEEETVEKPKFTTVSYGKEQMDKYLNNKESVDLLNSYGLKRPSEYKDKSLEEFQEAFDKGLDEAAKYKKIIKDVAIYVRF